DAWRLLERRVRVDRDAGWSVHPALQPLSHEEGGAGGDGADDLARPRFDFFRGDERGPLGFRGSRDPVALPKIKAPPSPFPTRSVSASSERPESGGGAVNPSPFVAHR